MSIDLFKININNTFLTTRTIHLLIVSRTTHSGWDSLRNDSLVVFQTKKVSRMTYSHRLYVIQCKVGLICDKAMRYINTITSYRRDCFTFWSDISASLDPLIHCRCDWHRRRGNYTSGWSGSQGQSWPSLVDFLHSLFSPFTTAPSLSYKYGRLDVKNVYY